MKISFLFAGKPEVDLALIVVAGILAIILIFLVSGRGKGNASARTKQTGFRGHQYRRRVMPAHSSFSDPVPCFLLLGPANSGKTALLNGLHQSYFSGERGWVTDLAAGVAHWHFAGGEIIEVAGSLFTPATQDDNAAGRWQSFLSHLQRRRRRRPLDGIVLAVPSTMLAGSDALSTQKLQSYALQASQQLKVLRDQLGFSLPVFVVITKCDAIPGYKTFVTAQLAAHTGEIFGWSNPYDLDAPFDPKWIAEGFAEVYRELSRQRVEFFTLRTGAVQDDSALKSELFLFPFHLMELQLPLAAYLGQFLEDCGHRDALQFRGIYFSGIDPRTAKAVAQRQPGANGAGSTSDLFEKKIFPERILARPSEAALAQRRIGLNLSRSLCAVALLLLFPGALLAWYQLFKASKQIVSHLREIRAGLSQAKDHISAASAYATIYSAQELSGGTFQSEFLPASLSGSLGQKVRAIMPAVFERLVYPGLRSELEGRASDLAMAHAHAESATSPSAAETDASQRLSSFTDALLNLESQVVLFNSVVPTGGGHAQSQTLLKLAASLSPGTFADLKIRSTSGLDEIVRASSVTPFEVQPWNKPLASRLEALVTDVLRQNGNEERLLALLDALATSINLLEENKLDTYEQLNSLLESLAQVQSYVATPDLQWLASTDDRLEMPGDLNRTLSRIFSRPARESILLCDTIGEDGSCASLRELQGSIEQMTRAHFAELRTLLLAAHTKTTGPILATTDAKLQLAQPTVDLQMVLDSFLKLPFVAREGAAHFRDVEAGQQLLWDNERLQAAIQDKKAYDAFFTGALAKTSDNLQDTFEEVALSRLEANMADSVASAQSFQPLPSGDQADQATTNEVRSFQAASQSLTQLLEDFSELNFDDDYQDLQRLTTNHALMVLARIDRAFDARHFYWPPAGNFDGWTADSLPSVVYGTHTPDEMDGYLLAQRQDVQRYSAAAQPLAAFLQNGGAGQKQTLIAKWRSIVNDLQKNESGGAGPGLGSVEEFLDSGMNKMAPPDCQIPASPASSSLIYFVRVRRSLEQALVSRCRSLSNRSAFQEYIEIANFFNERLAGKFPFSPPSDDAAAPEADPSDLTELFRRLDAEGKSIRQGLQASSGANPGAVARITTFLNQIDALHPMFAPLASGQAALPAFDVVPAFRVNRNHETNGNQIIDWSLQVGGNTFRNLDTPSTGRWSFGEPVKLLLRWAKDSPQQPVAVAPATGNPGRRTVIFEYHDPWSLLRMLAVHAAPATDLDRPVDPDPQTLEFTASQESSPTNLAVLSKAAPAIETNSNQMAKVFIRIRIYPVGKTDSLRIPPFPVQAPSP